MIQSETRLKFNPRTSQIFLNPLHINVVRRHNIYNGSNVVRSQRRIIRTKAPQHILSPEDKKLKGSQKSLPKHHL